MPHSVFNLICLDVDGTLIRSDKSISKFTLEEILRLNKLGVIFALVSSRMPNSLHRIFQKLKIDGPIISYNGALVELPKNNLNINPLIFEIQLDTSTTELIYQAITPISDNLHIGIFKLNKWYVNSLNYWCLREIRGTEVWPIQINFHNLENLTKDYKSGVHKIVIRGEKQTLDIVQTTILNLGIKDTLYRKNDSYIEVTSFTATKALAIKMIQEHYSILNANTMAFGDGSNDIDMIQYVGYGVAMANADQDLKIHAKEITMSNDEDGIGFVLRKHFPTTDDNFEIIG